MASRICLAANQGTTYWIGFTCDEVGLVNGLPQHRKNATGTRYAAGVCRSASRRQYREPRTTPPFVPNALGDADNREPFKQPKNQVEAQLETALSHNDYVGF